MLRRNPEHFFEMERKNMSEYRKDTEQLLEFIENSPSCFHAVANVAELLLEAGYTALSENESWDLVPGGKYYVTRNASSVIAFRIPSVDYQGYQLICSHTDSPTFKIKENPEMRADKNCCKLNVERYGGMLCAPWFDRPLSVAGRVLVQSENGIFPVLVYVNRDLLLIPNLAIHMNREANDGYKYNAQKDMCPLFSDEMEEQAFRSLIAETAGVQEKQILGMDLFLYNRQKGSIWGCKEEFVSAPRLDDLQCMYATLQGFLEADETKGENVPVFCAFDNEETGSVSRQGAASTFLRDTLYRINLACKRREEQYLTALAGSFMISADNAHAVHPNHTDLSDPVNRPQINQGIVIKYNSNQKYTTDAVSAAVFRSICERAGVPCQTFTNRSDMAGGSTLGNISNTQASMRAVDIGLPQLAMHSPYETAGVKDTRYLQQAAKEYYETTLELTEQQIRL